MTAALKRRIDAYDVVCNTDDEEAWHRYRATGLGATDMSCVLGLNPWRSALQLFVEKTGALPPADLTDREPVRWGRILEPIIGAEYARRTGRPFTRDGKLLRSSEQQWALCTLDGWTGLPANGNDASSDRWPIEIKTATAFGADEWVNGPPEHYLVQVQHQMLVTGAPRVTVACLLGGQRLVWCDVERDETLIRKIAYHGERFWQRVLDRDPPEPDGSESSRRVLSDLFPSDDGSTVELPMALAETIDEWQSLKREEKALRERITRCENVIKSTLGSASRGLLPTGDAVSWKEQSMPARTLQATSYRVLRYHQNKRR